MKFFNSGTKTNFERKFRRWRPLLSLYGTASWQFAHTDLEISSLNSGVYLKTYFLGRSERAAKIGGHYLQENHKNKNSQRTDGDERYDWESLEPYFFHTYLI